MSLEHGDWGITGVLPVWKPGGITSFDAIRSLRRSIGDGWKKLKTGHGGTLDPMAVGVLPILIGEATKAFDFLLQSDKIYTALVQAGSSTDTDDADGRVTSEGGRKVTREEVEALLPRFTGRISQVPPRYSAIRVNGVRSYELAREDGGVELSAREVTVHELSLLDFDDTAQRFRLLVRCSSGTYIRSIARDIGAALGSFAHLAGLERSKSGGITTSDCVPLDKIGADNWKGLLIPLEKALDFLPGLDFLPEPKFIINGRPLNHAAFASPPASNGIYRVMQRSKILALAEHRDGAYRYLRVFHAE